MKDNKRIKERTYEFALEVINLVNKLPKNTGGYVPGRQLMRAGTSVGYC